MLADPTFAEMSYRRWQRCLLTWRTAAMLLVSLLCAGHVPMLADPTFAEMVEAIGVASLGADDKAIWHLTKVSKAVIFKRSVMISNLMIIEKPQHYASCGVVSCRVSQPPPWYAPTLRVRNKFTHPCPAVLPVGVRSSAPPL